MASITVAVGIGMHKLASVLKRNLVYVPFRKCIVVKKRFSQKYNYKQGLVVVSSLVTWSWTNVLQ